MTGTGSPLVGLSRALLRRLPVARIVVLLQFVQFAIVGVAGLAAETATIYALRRRIGIYVLGLLAYAVSATVTWWLNRIWTFESAIPVGSRSSQWARYALANAPGFLLNRTLFFTLVTLSGLCAENPILAVSAGSLAGLFSNFTFSRLLVFNASAPKPAVAQRP